MNCQTAFFDLTSPSTEERPLMLHELLFCPILTWACEELSVRGIQRFFVICDEKWEAEAKKALQDFPGAQVFSRAEDALCAAEGMLLMLPSPILPVDVFSVSPVYAADVFVLRAHLAAGRPLTARPEGAQAADVAFLPFRSAEELQRAMPICREHIISRHSAKGIFVMDAANTYIDPRCCIGEGTTILPGTILRGRTVIGSGPYLLENERWDKHGLLPAKAQMGYLDSIGIHSSDATISGHRKPYKQGFLSDLEKRR